MKKKRTRDWKLLYEMEQERMQDLRAQIHFFETQEYEIKRMKEELDLYAKDKKRMASYVEEIARLKHVLFRVVERNVDAIDRAK